MGSRAQRLRSLSAIGNAFGITMRAAIEEWDGRSLAMQEDAKAIAEGASATRVPLGAVEFAERLLRWASQAAARTPIDDFATGLGAVWLSFCFDHDLNPFDELHGIIARFPLAEALGTKVPDWAKPPYPEDPRAGARAGECSICRRRHGPEVQHACE